MHKYIIEDASTSNKGSSLAKPLTKNIYPKNREEFIRKNPLSNYSSYTYNLTLYITTPEGLREYLNLGRLNANENYYIVAQSGGIGEEEKRAFTTNGVPGIGKGLDFYIEDLNFEMFMPGYSPVATVGTELTFKIVEPYGFTFFKRMQDLNIFLNNSSSIIKNSKNKPVVWQQHYILGIKFYGYDRNGKIITSQEFAGTENLSVTSDNYGTFQRLFPIVIKKISHKLDGKAVTYNVQANALNLQTAYGSKRGIIIKDATIVARTVGEALENIGAEANSSRGLMQILNEDQEDQKVKEFVKYPNIYSIEWEENSEIVNSQIFVENDNNRAPPSPGVKRVEDSTVKNSVNANTIDTSKVTIPITKGTPIISIIDNIITKSSFVRNKLTAINNAALETRSNSNTNTSAELLWFNINPKVIPIQRDEKRQDWVYKIIYQIQTYYVPYTRALWKGGTTQYYGAHKQYNYFLTGENTEIINYEQTYDNQYYMVRSNVISRENVSTTENIGSTVPIAASGGMTGSSAQGGPLKENAKEMETRASVVSIADQASAAIKIFGDPDFLMENISSMPSFTSSSFYKFYGKDGFSINPLGGQVFIEIVFNVAEDYGKDGLLDVSDQVLFYDDPGIKKGGVKGVVYRVKKVTHNFSRGLFTQTLELLYVSKDRLKIGTTPPGSSSGGSAAGTVSGGTAGTGTNNTPGTSTENGVRKDTLRLDGGVVTPIRNQ